MFTDEQLEAVAGDYDYIDPYETWEFKPPGYEIDDRIPPPRPQTPQNSQKPVT